MIRHVATPEGSLHARVEGEGGPTVVFAADPPNVVEHYDRLVALVAARRRVVVFEPMGFGRSRPRRGFDHGVEAHARAVRALLDALGPGPFVLAFPCVTAYVAVAVAAAERERVSHVVLVQAPSWAEERAWARRVDPKGLLATPFVGQALLAFGRKAVARRWYRAALPRGADVAAFERPAFAALAAGGRFPLADAFQAMRKAPAPALAPVRQPALAVWGPADRTHRRTDRGSTLAHAPGARLVDLDGCGHFPELEAPERFVAELDAFLAR